MRFKVSWSAGALVLSLGLVLAGCGGDPEEEEQTTSSLCAPLAHGEDDGDSAENCLDVIERDDSIED